MRARVTTTLARPTFLSLALLAGACAHGEAATAPRSWPEELRLDGRALVLRDLAAEGALADPRPASMVPSGTIYATAVAELVREAALEEMDGLFREGSEAGSEPARRKGFRAVVTPRAVGLGGASGLAVSISVVVELLDPEGNTIREARVDGGTLQGRADFPRGVAGPRIGAPAQNAIDRLARRAAETLRTLAAGG